MENRNDDRTGIDCHQFPPRFGEFPNARNVTCLNRRFEGRNVDAFNMLFEICPTGKAVRACQDALGVG
jgi:hypothetical protein